MSEQSAAESAVTKLEAFLAGLSPEEQAELAPLISGGMERAFENAQGDVVGMSSTALSIEPKFLQFVASSKTPVLHGLGGASFFPPMPVPM
jgi:hypothetical protein